MLFEEKKPILFSCPAEYDSIVIYSIHDLHFGNECFNEKRWKKLKEEILSQPNHFCVFVGDLFENAIPNSKGDCFSQTHTPQQQKEWITQQLIDLKPRTIAVVPGNHEYNRTTKACGLYPLYDCCLLAGIGHLYRNAYAVVDVGVGDGGHGKGKQIRYVGYLTHKAKDNKQHSTAHTLEGFDFMFFGHDHDPKDKARAKLVYDNKNKSVSFKDVEVINNGAFLDFGGYGARDGYPPPATKMYKLILDGKTKDIKSLGFHLR